MQLFTELTPPTAVTHSLSLPFLSTTANNLVIAKTSLLQIFSFKSVVQDVGEPLSPVENHHSTPTTPWRRSERSSTTKLVLVGQYELSGTVAALARVKIAGSLSGGEALLVSLRDAKMSLVQWDPERYTLSTISIHTYEREDLQSSPFHPELHEYPSFLTVDPRSRCAALMFGARSLAILPFHQADDDLMMDDNDADDEEDAEKDAAVLGKLTNGEASHSQTPFQSSFVLSLLLLDPNLVFPVHLAFLYEYREPTFGILSSKVAASSALLHERRDIISYTVYTMDLDQRASTTLLSITGLPYDLFTICPLPLPIGGSLLVGCNEIIHVDQSGKTNGIAINEFAKMCSSFPLPHQSDLNLKLEGCMVEQLGTPAGEMLLILGTGELAILGFERDGRTISGLSLQLVPAESGTFNLSTGCSCISGIGRGRLFMGSELGDSIVMGWSKKGGKAKKRHSAGAMEVDDGAASADEDDEDLDDEDDLYAESKPEPAVQARNAEAAQGSSADEFMFRIHDRLLNLAPMSDVVVKNNGVAEESTTTPSVVSLANMQVVVSSGQGQRGTLYEMSRKLKPSVQDGYDLAAVQRLWSLTAQRPLEQTENQLAQWNNVLITSSVANDTAESSLYYLEDGKPREVVGTDFGSVGVTLEVLTINDGSHIVQVQKTHFRVLSSDFSLAQIVPLSDENEDGGVEVVRVSFAEPYMLLILNDLSARLFKAEESGDLEEIEPPDAFKEQQWTSGSLFDDANDVFRLESEDDDEDEAGNVLVFLLGIEGGLQVYHLPDLTAQVFAAGGLSFLPPFLSAEFAGRRLVSRETVTEILVAELGDETAKSPYMILRTDDGNITIYHPFQSPIPGTSNTALRFLKVSSPYFPETQDDDSDDDDDDDNDESPKPPLQAIADINGYSMVFVPGASPSFIVKSAASPPCFLPLDAHGVRSLSRFHRENCKQGFLYVNDHGEVNAAQLAPDEDYSTGWAVRKIYSGQEIGKFTYHTKSGRYVLGTNELVPFKLPDDEIHPEWAKEDITLYPLLPHSTITLLAPSTRTITQTLPLAPAEYLTSLATLPLETSEVSSHIKPLVVATTTFLRGPDLPCAGHVYVFDVVPVAPDPAVPGSELHLKLLAKEEVKASPVSSVAGAGEEGFLVVVQGMKIMVRGLKEDGSLLPVAFLDTGGVGAGEVKELKGTGLCCVGDAARGVWLVGYSTEPPVSIKMFSKSRPLPIATLSFLPDGPSLYIIGFDLSGTMHVFQYDPEHPKSLSGQHLLPLSRFALATPPPSSHLLRLAPHPASPTPPSPPHALLLPHRTGSLALLLPVAQNAYLTLLSHQASFQNPSGSGGSGSTTTTTAPGATASSSTTTTTMTATGGGGATGGVNHYLGLNPKEFRKVESDFSVGGRVVVDGGLLRRGVLGLRGKAGREVRGLVGGLLWGRGEEWQ